MNRKYFWFWIVLIAILAFFTEELVNFMMLFLILLTLLEISDEIKKRNATHGHSVKILSFEIKNMTV